MASGIDHYKAFKKGTTLFTVAWIVTWAGKVFLGFPSLANDIAFSALIQYVIFCRYIGPDLDQITLTDDEQRMKRELLIIGMVFVLYWTLYSFIMNSIAIILGISHGRLGAHRTWLTHSAFGTLFRIVYFNVPVYFVKMLWNTFVTASDMQELFISWNSPVVYIYLIGQLLAFFRADSIHYKLDNI